MLDEETKPRLRGVLHHAAFDLSLVSGTLLVLEAEGIAATAASLVYAASVSALFGASALYHRLPWRPPARRRMQRLDYAMIFVLIAGTYTPLLVVGGDGPGITLLFVGVWAFALVGIAVRLLWLSAPVTLVGSLYLGLGWVGILALPHLWTRTGPAPVLLIIAGGLLYTAGAACLGTRRPNPSPALFGYHEVFHAFVVAAAVCHYAAIALVVL
jgi:hemolysin III